jgi:hypothetical protein
MTTYSTSLKLELPGDGQQSGTWGQTTNKNLGTLLEQAITGVGSITMLDTTYTLSFLNGVVDEARNAVIVVGGTNSAIRNVVVPPVEKTYTFKNSTTGGYAIGVKTASGTAFNVQNGATIDLYCDGTDVYPTTNMAPTPAAGDSSQSIATTAFVNSYLPVGMIVMWSGSIASIPSGWALCDGSAGTPNLRDRFIVGAGSTYAVGATGGSANAIVVSHTHAFTGNGNTGTAGNHTHSVNDPGHSHTYNNTIVGGAVYTDHSGNDTPQGYNFPQTSSSSTGISINANGDHTHTATVTGTTDSSGSSATNANLPPYYALAYIMKV